MFWPIPCAHVLMPHKKREYFFGDKLNVFIGSISISIFKTFVAYIPCSLRWQFLSFIATRIPRLCPPATCQPWLDHLDPPSHEVRWSPHGSPDLPDVQSSAAKKDTSAAELMVGVAWVSSQHDRPFLHRHDAPTLGGPRSQNGGTP